MRILVIQHSDKEHAGAFRPLFERDGHELVTCVAPHMIDDVDLASIDGVWVLGGLMQVWEAEELPWLAREIAVIREAVLERELPYFGICLGHQLLAHVLGGHISLATQSEVGLLHVAKHGNPPIFDGMPDQFPCFQWHSAEVSRLPEGAEILASSGRCNVQALSWGRTAHSVQFHAELDAATLADWYEIEDCEEMLRKEIGSDADLVFDALSASEVDLARMRQNLYRHWFASVPK